MKKLSLPFVFLFFSFNFYAQDKNLINIRPIPPDVASLIKSVEYPVNPYNGTSQFNIPIHQIREGDLKLDINLNYSSNGLKVTEEASWVGLGWSLDVGGVIQLIRGSEPQDTPTIHPVPYAITNPNSGYMGNINIMERGCRFRDEYGNVTDYGDEIIGSQRVYDMYIYNFGGYSGKFIRPSQYEFVDLSNNNIRFELISGSNGLKAIAPDGTQYIFDIIGESVTPNPGTPCNPPDGYAKIDYSYHLTKIISPQNREMNFTYVSYRPVSLPAYHQTKWKKHVYGSSGTLNEEGSDFVISNTTHNDYILTEINTQNTQIKFFTSSRIDMGATNSLGQDINAKKLDHIAIYNAVTNEVEPLKVIRFNYDYFYGSSSYGDWTSMDPLDLGACTNAPINNSYDENFKRMRLRLWSVQFTDQIRSYNLTGHPTYKFNYDSQNLPYKTSFAQDLWGYYNGQQINTSMIPNYQMLGYIDPELPIGTFDINGTALRAPNESFLKAGILTEITQPSGSKTEIDYEINSVIEIPGLFNNYQPLVAAATDIDTGFQEDTFTIPYTQQVTINIILYCDGPSPCNSSTMNDCPTPSWGSTDAMQSVWLGQPQSDGTYSWEIFTKANLIGNDYACQTTFTRLLSPGTYKIRAYYPDQLVGSYGWAMSSIGVNYIGLVDNDDDYLGPGLRIKSTMDIDTDGTIYNEKYYNYVNGRLMSKPQFFTHFDNVQAQYMTTVYNPSTICISGISGGCDSVIYEDYISSLSSHSTIPYSFNASGRLVGYDEVIINYGIDGKEGQEILKYNNTIDLLNTFSGMILSGVTGHRAFDNGLIKERIVKKNINPTYTNPMLRKVLSEKYLYKILGFKEYWAYQSKNMGYNCSNGDVNSTFAGNFLQFYPIKSGKPVIDKRTITNYDGTSNELPTLIETIDYNYNSHYQLAEEIHSTSIADTEEKVIYKYPWDLLSDFNNHPNMSGLVGKNIINPKIAETHYKLLPDGSEEKILDSKTKYQYLGNMYLPEAYFQNKGDNLIDEQTDLKLEYTLYDTQNGNLKEYRRDNGTFTSFIWGYNKEYPIAKIENAAYAQVQTYVSNLQTLSNADNDRTVGATGNEGALRSALNNLRNLFPNANIITYTYDPLVGLTSITDTRGNTVYYEYDELNRLKRVKDKDGNILSENEYHYAIQN